MLYILFGRDKIGKKTVRDFICEHYGIIIVPKFTDDSKKKWVLNNYNGYTSPKEYTLPDQEQEILEEKAKLSKEGIDCRICDAKDKYLRWLSERARKNISAFRYEITKIYENNTYQAAYYIKQSHLRKAIRDIEHDYLIVCASGETINQIRQFIDEERKISTVSDLRIIHVEGKSLRGELSERKTSWKYMPSLGELNSGVMDIPAAFLFEYSHLFAGKLRNDHHFTKEGTIDRSKVESNLALQWERITGMLPLSPKAFIVRPFKAKSALTSKNNVNDLIADKIYKLVDEWGQNSIDFVQLSNYQRNNIASIFESMDRALTESQIIIIDLREHRRNCYYEYGFAMGLHKAFENHGKRIFCLIGVESQESNYEKLTVDEKEEMLGALLNDMEQGKAFDVILFPHYKYIVENFEDEDFNSSINIKFIQATNQDGDFKKDFIDMISPVIEKRRIKISDLATNKDL